MQIFGKGWHPSGETVFKALDSIFLCRICFLRHSSTLFANSKWHQVPSDFVLENVFGKKQPVSETSVSEIEESDLEFPDENAEKEKQKKSDRIKKTKK